MTRVVVVDDEPQIVRASQINLKARRYEVHTAPNGTAALTLAAQHPPDLTKPFGIDELLARLRAVLRRSNLTPEEPVVAFVRLRCEKSVRGSVVGVRGVLVRRTPAATMPSVEA